MGKKYSLLLWGQITISLLVGAILPFFGRELGFSPYLALREIIFDVGYWILVTPYFVLALFLGLKAFAVLNSADITPQKVVSHLSGGTLAFLPFVVYDSFLVLDRNTPQGPSYILVAFFSLVLIYCFYSLGCLLGNSIMKCCKNERTEDPNGQ